MAVKPEQFYVLVIHPVPPVLTVQKAWNDLHAASVVLVSGALLQDLSSQVFLVKFH